MQYWILSNYYTTILQNGVDCGIVAPGPFCVVCVLHVGVNVSVNSRIII